MGVSHRADGRYVEARDQGGGGGVHGVPARMPLWESVEPGAWGVGERNEEKIASLPTHPPTRPPAHPPAPQAVETVLGTMVHAGVVPSPSNYRVVLQTLRDSNQWHKSEALIAVMKRRGVEVGQIDYDLAIAATSRVGAVDGADRLAGLMEADGLRHTDTTLCSRLRAAAAASQYVGGERAKRREGSGPPVSRDINRGGGS